MATVRTVTEVARHFSDIINRVVFRGERFILMRGKRVVAELRPAQPRVTLADLASLCATAPHLLPDDDQFGEDVEAARASVSGQPLRDPWV